MISVFVVLMVKLKLLHDTDNLSVDTSVACSLVALYID